MRSVVQVLKALKPARCGIRGFPAEEIAVGEAERRVCYRSKTEGWSRSGEGELLVRKAGNASRETTAGDARQSAKTVERRYVPVDEDRPRPDEKFETPGVAAENGAASAKASMREVFGPGGFLEKCMKGGFDRSVVGSDYEYRAAQLEMAELVHDAFESHHHAIVEAGTGTGKTLAYLVPAIRSGRRVVISTATKSLQEQLFEKDIPFLRKHFAPELKVALMKGRNNFVCREKVHLMEGQPVLRGMDEIDWFAQIRDWEKLTETGDRAELNFLPDDAELWNRIDARKETCTGQKCPQFQQCFLTAMRQRAQEADVIIVNHHLFFADLALRQDDFGSILPEYAAVVFDEAHEIEDVASDYFGRELSSYRFEELTRDVEATLRILKIEAAPLRRQIARLRERARTFF